jgi:hypothetical protein
VQGLVVEAKTEIQENLSQQWVLTVKLRKTLKGRSKDEVVTVFTDSPVIRFKGSFVNKQFVMFLDLKYRNPVTYELLGAEPVSAATVATIEQRVEVLKKKK